MEGNEVFSPETCHPQKEISCNFWQFSKEADLQKKSEKYSGLVRSWLGVNKDVTEINLALI